MTDLSKDEVLATVKFWRDREELWPVGEEAAFGETLRTMERLTPLLDGKGEAPAEAIGALATAMWDAVHTARLSEHPEETEQMVERAKATARWLGRFGWSLVRTDALAAVRAEERERAAQRAGDYLRHSYFVLNHGMDGLADDVEAAIRARTEEPTDAK